MAPACHTTLFGNLTGFLLFNFSPAEIFMDDGSSLFLGFTIVSTNVICATKTVALAGLALPALALGIPIFDAAFSMLRWFLECRSMFAPDRSRLHHRLLDLGLCQRHAVIAIYLVTLLTAGLGSFMLVNQNVRCLVVFGCLLLRIVLLFRIVGAVYLGGTLAGQQRKYVHSQGEQEEWKTFEHLPLRFRHVQDPNQWWPAMCEAARLMDFAWVAHKTAHAGGRSRRNCGGLLSLRAICPGLP